MAVLPPRLRDVEQCLEFVGRVDERAAEDGAALRVQLKNKLGDDSKVRPRATDAPEEVRVLRRTGDEDAAVRRNNGGLRYKLRWP